MSAPARASSPAIGPAGLHNTAGEAGWTGARSGLALRIVHPPRTGSPEGTGHKSGDRARVIPARSKTSPPGDTAAADAAFAARIACGEQAAMREAVEEFLPQVFATAKRMLRNEADAEEVAQETFLRIWNSVGTWTPKGARLRTWVVRIAINLCYDRMRRKSYGKSDPLEAAPEMADDAPDAVARLAARDQSSLLEQAMNGLPERQRLALQLVHFDEMSNGEAAETMDVSVDALESLLARGRRGLKAALMGHKDELLGEEA
ncbi:RNA polymerase sigma factor [Pyruvatibacter mobilis]|uniref:RNA polymerase sigma factor n=1 Tax=Pyruvatibacter mobilis TaxID=1712261 RepID=UPI003BB00065